MTALLTQFCPMCIAKPMTIVNAKAERKLDAAGTESPRNGVEVASSWSGQIPSVLNKVKNPIFVL